MADKVGRKWPLAFTSIFMFILALISSFSPNFIVFIIFRSLFGCIVGFNVPISFTILAENTPLKQRGVVLALIGVFYTMGELLVCFLALITMQNLDSGNWRLMLSLSSFPGLLIAILSFLFLKESPRFLLIKKKN